MREGYGELPAPPKKAGPIFSREDLDLSEGHGPPQGLAERLLCGKAGRKPLHPEFGPRPLGVGELLRREKPKQSSLPMPLKKGSKARDLHDIDAYPHRTMRIRSAWMMASTRVTAAESSSFTTR